MNIHTRITLLLISIIIIASLQAGCLLILKKAKVLSTAVPVASPTLPPAPASPASSPPGPTINAAISPTPSPAEEYQSFLDDGIDKVLRSRHKEAIPPLLKAAKARPRDGEAHFWLFQAYKNTDTRRARTSKACIEAQNVIALMPGSPQAQQAQDFISAIDTAGQTAAAQVPAKPAPRRSQRQEITFGSSVTWTKQSFRAYIDRLSERVGKATEIWLYKSSRGMDCPKDAINYSELPGDDQHRLFNLHTDSIQYAQKFPDDKDTPDVLHTCGWLLEELKPLAYEAEAAKIYGFLVANYPASEEAARARVRLDKLH